MKKTLILIPIGSMCWVFAPPFLESFLLSDYATSYQDGFWQGNFRWGEFMSSSSTTLSDLRLETLASVTLPVEFCFTMIWNGIDVNYSTQLCHCPEWWRNVPRGRQPLGSWRVWRFVRGLRRWLVALLAKTYSLGRRGADNFDPQIILEAIISVN